MKHLKPKAELPATPEVWDAIDRINRNAIDNITARRQELIDLVYSTTRKRK